MANISQIKLPNGDVYNFQDSVSDYLVPSDIEGKVDNFHIQIGEQISGDYYSIDKTYADILMTAFVGKDYMTCSDVDLGYPYVGIASIDNNTVIAFGVSVTFNNTAYLDGYVILPNDTAMRIHEATIIPTKTSQLTNDSGFITSYTETDPTVPSWAKASSKPTYTASEVGALPSNTTYVSTITTTAGTHSAISNKSGAVSFNVPTKTSHLTNDSGFATTSYVDSAINALPEPMLFKGSVGTGGTVTSLPTAAASNEGWTYKVITALSNPSAKVGDTVISNGSSWIVIPSGDEPNGTVTSVGVTNATNGGLTVSGSPITSSGTITIGHSNVLSSAQTTQAVYPIKIDKNGHISAYGSAVTIPTVPSNIVNTITTTAGAHTTISSQKGNVSFNVPTKTSHLTNDSGFITSSALNNYLPLTGGNVTGPVNFGDTVSIDSATIGNLVVNGGASFVNSKAIANQLIDSLDTASANWTDNTLILTSDVAGDTNLYYRREAVKAWNYIDGKISAAGYTKNAGTITSVKTTAGAHTAINTTSGAVSFNVPTTAAHVGIKFGYTTSGNNRAVLQDSSGNLYVTQKDTDTTVSTLTLDEDTGTSAITLAHSGKYKLTAGTKTLIFTMPASGNTDHRKSFYGTCSTAAGTAAKVISLSTTTGWELVAGTTITVKFSATNTAQNPTFNVNSSGAKSVWYNTAVITTGSLNRAGYATRPQMYVYDGSHWVWMGMSAEDNTTYSVMSASELSTGTATSARTMSAANTKAGLLDLFYPVGSYYETSDTDFDPNTKWGGTWVLEVAGQVHVSAGTGYTVSGALNNTSDGGSKDAIIPYHNHSVAAVTNGITGGGHTHEPSTASQSFLTLGSSLTNGIGRTNAGSGSAVKSVLTSPDGAVSRIANTNSTTHSHDLPAHNTNYAGTSGNATNANMQPYVVVNRWHRTA